MTKLNTAASGIMTVTLITALWIIAGCGNSDRKPEIGSQKPELTSSGQPAADSQQRTAKIQQLIKQLSGDDSQKRETAQAELLKMGETIIPLLEKTAKETKDTEVKSRCNIIIQQLNAFPQDPNGNFILYVSNQTFEISPVDIKILIDGRWAIQENFEVGNQHNWKQFQFQLSKGKHLIKAESVKGEAVLEKEFEITDKHWAVLDYWVDIKAARYPVPKYFTFNFTDKPVMFR